ncbi:hypothetical protein [Corynebacterium halotolerans]|nr:hypothetical protein [Corynebacterium halotolerans]
MQVIETIFDSIISVVESAITGVQNVFDSFTSLSSDVVNDVNEGEA